MEQREESGPARGSALVATLVERPPLVGRDDLLARAVDLLTDPAARPGATRPVRLLTLTGPGGVGKTTLALAVAAAAPAFADGVAVAELAAERDPDRLLAAVVQILALEVEGVETPLRTLVRALTGRRLLVLDNLEQLRSGATALADLLADSPGLTILASSRMRLGLPGEHELPVPTLPVPISGSPSLGAVAASPAVALFARRARQANPAFALTAANAPAVAEICRRLDGLPLALELGAARLRLLAPEALLARLDQRLEVLGGGPRDAPSRHRTIRDTVGWSVDLLRPEERRLFTYLAIFAGGCAEADLAAVAAAVDAERGLDPMDASAAADALLAGGLLQPSTDENGDNRLAMLESVRDVAAERLAADGLTAVARRAHAARYLAVAERDGPRLRGDSATQQRVWNGLNADLGNHRAALSHYLASGDASGGLRLAAGLDWFWTDGALLREGIDWIKRLTAAAESAASEENGVPVGLPPRLWGDAHRLLSVLYDWLARHEESERAVDRAIRALAGIDAAASLAEVLMSAAGVAQERGRLTEARAYAERGIALATVNGLDWAEATMRVNLAVTLIQLGETAAAAEHAAAAAARYRRIGEEGAVIAAVNTLGLAQLAAGDLDPAAASFLDALTAAGSMAGEGAGEGPYHQALFTNAGLLAARLDEAEPAVRLLAAAAAECRRTGIPTRKPVKDEVDAELDRLRSALGEPRFQTAWAAGASLAQAEQIAEADAFLRSRVTPVLTGKLGDLTARELEVLGLLVGGASDKQIGERLYISSRTASFHVSHVLAKLDLPTRTAAAAYGAAHGLRAGSSP